MVKLLPLFQRQNTNDEIASLLLQSIASSILLLCFSLFTACGSGGDGELGNALGQGGDRELGNARDLRDALNITSENGTVSLTWNPVADSSIKGYFVYYGTTSPNSFGSCGYPMRKFTRTNTIKLHGLTPGTQYFFAVSAFNGLESACSAEASTIVRSA